MSCNLSYRTLKAARIFLCTCLYYMWSGLKEICWILALLWVLLIGFGDNCNALTMIGPWATEHIRYGMHSLLAGQSYFTQMQPSWPAFFATAYVFDSCLKPGVQNN